MGLHTSMTRPPAGRGLLQSGVIHVVFRNCCLTGETMSAKFGVWWSGPVAAAICVLCLLLGRVPPSAQEGQFFRIGAASTSGTFFEIGGVIATPGSQPGGAPPSHKGGRVGGSGVVSVKQAAPGALGVMP